jgi:heat shock protein HslJ
MTRIVRSPRRYILLLLVLLTALSACGLPAATPTPSATATRPAPTPTFTPTPMPTQTSTPTPDLSGLPAGVWQLVRIEYMSGKVVTIEKPENYTVQFQGGGRMSIKADCNGGAGTFQVSERKLTIGALITTEMACPPGSLDNQFVQGLTNAAAYVLDGEEFTISMGYDSGEMVFRKAQ